ncbi:hypothetical protein ABZP36_009766 [Zizania latifolia]
MEGVGAGHRLQLVIRLEILQAHGVRRGVNCEAWAPGVRHGHTTGVGVGSDEEAPGPVRKRWSARRWVAGEGGVACSEARAQEEAQDGRRRREKPCAKVPWCDQAMAASAGSGTAPADQPDSRRAEALAHCLTAPRQHGFTDQIPVSSRQRHDTSQPSRFQARRSLPSAQPLRASAASAPAVRCRGPRPPSRRSAGWFPHRRTPAPAPPDRRPLRLRPGPEVTPAPGCAPSDCTSPSRPPLKRPHWEPPQYLPPPPIPQPAQPRPVLPPSNSSSGRYVSKRERALLTASLSTMESASSLPPSVAAEFGPPVVGSISDSNLRADILHSLRCQPKCGSTRRWPLKLSVSLSGHTKAANSVDWSPSHAHLLASAGMDRTVQVFNVWNKGNTTARALKFHTGAVKDVKWSLNGLSLLSGGYDCSLRLVDVEEGKEIKVFKEDQAMEVIKFNPINPNLFLSGGCKGSLRLWDIRCGLVTKEYHRNLGTILDIEFSADGKQFISSTDTSRSNISDNSIIIWDTLRQVPLSNQVYTEAYTCPCVRYHPYEACFVAQSNGNYIAMFSARPPFKLNKYMRFEGHGVWGFPIKCNFSLSGKELASGSSDGCVYFYDYKTSRLLSKIEAFKEACTDVAYHPVMPNVIAACSWAGEICIFE